MFGPEVAEFRAGGGVRTRTVGVERRKSWPVEEVEWPVCVCLSPFGEVVWSGRFWADTQNLAGSYPNLSGRYPKTHGSLPNLTCHFTRWKMRVGREKSWVISIFCPIFPSFWKVSPPP